MTTTKKQIRNMVGFTFLKQSSDSDVWYRKASDFNRAAILLGSGEREEFCVAYYYNAGLSLELILKAITISKKIEFKTTHKLIGLAKTAGVTVSTDQECTLELLSEIIIWSGRYPSPKSEMQWNDYHDKIQEKHIIREQNGKTGSTMINRSRFPTIENYSKLWSMFESEYINSLRPPS